MDNEKDEVSKENDIKKTNEEIKDDKISEQNVDNEKCDTKENNNEEVDFNNEQDKNKEFEKHEEVNVDDKQDEEENIIDDEIKNKNRKKFFICIFIALIILIISIFVTSSKYENKVYPNIFGYDESVAKLNESQLDKELLNIENKIRKSKIYIKTTDTEYVVDIKDFIKDYKNKDIKDKVFKYGKKQNKVKQFADIIMGGKKIFKFNCDLNEDGIKEIIQKIAKQTNKKCEEPKAIIERDTIKYNEGKEGLKLDENSLYKNLVGAIKNKNITTNIKIDADYKKDIPKINILDLKKVDSKISSYSTNYGGGGGRGKNIEVSVKKLDDTIVMPGEEFSYEKAIGPVTIENGYTYAPVIINKTLQSGVGGGVCQVSSTVYNAQLKAGILPTERRNHTIPSNYVPRGLDATLATGSIDYKFRNTYNYPIIINSYTSNGNIYIEFWSNKEALNGIEYKPVSYVNGRVANTYLYGYDKNGKKVYEKHVDTSVYK